MCLTYKNFSIRLPNILRNNTQYVGGPDTTSRDEIISLQSQCSKLWLSSDSKLFSDNYLQTTFAGFFINNIVNPLVAFSLGLSTNFGLGPANIPFDIVNIDTENGWNKTSNAYIVQVPGVYVISFSMAASLTALPFIGLHVKPSFLVGLYVSDGRVRNGIETASRTVLVDLIQGDELSAVLHQSITYSDIRYQTSMKGFLYKPYQTLPISWCVIWEESDNLANIVGPIDPVVFNIIFTNQGSGWDQALNRFITPLSGTYYIQLTAGIYTAKPTKMELLVNGSPIVNVYRQFTSHSWFENDSRAVILQLQQDDELRIRLPSGYYLHTNINRYTAFSGFRIYS